MSCMVILVGIHSKAQVIPALVHRVRTVTKTPHLDVNLPSSTKYGQFSNNFVADHKILRHLS